LGKQGAFLGCLTLLAPQEEATTRHEAPALIPAVVSRHTCRSQHLAATEEGGPRCLPTPRTKPWYSPPPPQTPVSSRAAHKGRTGARELLLVPGDQLTGPAGTGEGKGAGCRARGLRPSPLDTVTPADQLGHS